MATSNISDYVLISVEDQTNHPLEIIAPMEDLSPFGYSVAAVVLFFILVFGVCNNLLVIVVVAGTRKLRTPMNCILLNLSVSDLLISALGTPMSFVAAINRGWIFGDLLCQMYAFSMTLTGMTAIGTLSAIAIDRYIIISRSFAGQNLTGVSSTLTILAIWVYSLAQALPPLLGWNRYIVEHPGIACSLDWQTPDVSHSSYIVYIFVLGYVLPVLIMAFCYGRVVSMIRRSSNPAVRSSTAKAERKVTVMAIMMLVCTLVAWTPYAVVSLMVSLGYGHLLGPVSSVSPAIFAKTSVVYNPVVYFFFNTQIRECILSKFPRFRKRRQGVSGGDISLETKRGFTVMNTFISNQPIGNNGNANTPNL